MHKTFWLLAALLMSPVAHAFTLTDTWIFGGHQGEVIWGTLTPDGQRVYTQSGPQLLAWNAKSGTLLSSKEPAQPFRVESSNLGSQPAPAGERLLVTVGEGEQAHLRLLELATAQLSADFGVMRGGVLPQWTAQQTAVAFATYNVPQLHYWRQSDQQVRSITLSTESRGMDEWAVAFAPDAQVLYALSASGNLSAYDAATSALLWQRRPQDMTGRNGQPLSAWNPGLIPLVLSHNPARPQLLMSSSDGFLLLDTQTPNTQTSSPKVLWLDKDLLLNHNINLVDWNKDGSRLYLTLGDFIHEIDTATGQTVGIVDGTRVLAQTERQTWSQTWDHVLLSERATGFDTALVAGAPAWNAPLALSSMGEPVAVLLKDAAGLSVKDLATGQQVTLSDHFTRAARFSPDGLRVASVGPAGVQVMDSVTHQVLWRAKAQNSYDLSFSPDGRWLALGEGGQTRLFDSHTGELQATLQPTEQDYNAGARGLNRALAFSPDGQQLLIGYEAGGAALWNLAQRKVTLSIGAAKGWILSAAVSLDGKTVALGSGGGEVRTLSLAGGQADKPRTVTLKGAVRSVTFAPDGSLAAASLGQDLRRWDATGKLSFSVPLDAAPTALAFAGSTLLVGDAAGALRQYDAAGKLLDSIQTGSLIQSLDVNPTTAKVLVSQRDNTLRSYTLNPTTVTSEKTP